jgi:tetratricopeptide (TPR) repeat protein
MAAAGVLVLVLALAAWFGTRFDVLGRANAAYDRRAYRTALEAARDHLRRFPNDRDAALMAARCLARLGRAREAEPYYRRAEPLELAEMQVRAYGLVQASDPEGAARVYEELLRRRPDDALALRRQAAVRMGQKRWRSSLELAHRLTALPPEAVAGWTLAAIAHHELKHHEQAVDAGRRVLALDPSLEAMPLPRALFWNNLALDLMALGRTAEARGYLEQALARAEDPGLMELLGLAYSHEGSPDQAERCWLQAERWDPNNADVCLDLGRLAMSRRRWGEAVDFLRRAAARSTEAVEPLYNLSQAYRMLGNRDEADRYRRLADRRRAALPSRRRGMGEDIDRSDAPDREGPAHPRPEPAR